MSFVNCILIRQRLTYDVTDRKLIWKVFFVGVFFSNSNKINRKIIIKHTVHVYMINDDQGIVNKYKSLCICTVWVLQKRKISHIMKLIFDRYPKWYILILCT